MSSSAVHFIPIVTTLLAVPFALEIFRRYRAHPERLHLLWWALGIATYGVGTFTESLTSVFGWQEPWVRRFSPFVNLDAVVPLVTDRDDLVARVNAAVLGGQASANTLRVLRQQIDDLTDPRQARTMVVGLALGSPEFQRQ